MWTLVASLHRSLIIQRYLLTYDPIAFHGYLEMIIASNTTNYHGNAKQNQSPWLLTDAANVIFQTAKRRCYVMNKVPKGQQQAAPPTGDADDEDAWAALDEVEGTVGTEEPSTSSRPAKRKWMPKGMEPVLEELPKWSLLADILYEIEEEMMRQESIKQPSKYSWIFHVPL